MRGTDIICQAICLPQWMGQFKCVEAFFLLLQSLILFPLHSSSRLSCQKQTNILLVHFLCSRAFSQTNTVSLNVLWGFSQINNQNVWGGGGEPASQCTAVVLSSDWNRGTDSSVRERGPRCYRKVKWQAGRMKRLWNKACGWPIEMSCTRLPLIREALLGLTELLGPDTPGWSVPPAPTRASVCVCVCVCVCICTQLTNLGNEINAKW